MRLQGVQLTICVTILVVAASLLLIYDIQSDKPSGQLSLKPPHHIVDVFSYNILVRDTSERSSVYITKIM